MSAKSPKNAPGPKIARPKLNKHHQKPAKPNLHPEIHTQQLNPISGRYGQPQYRDEKIPSHSKKLISRIRNS